MGEQERAVLALQEDRLVFEGEVHDAEDVLGEGGGIRAVLRDVKHVRLAALLIEEALGTTGSRGALLEEILCDFGLRTKMMHGDKGLHSDARVHLVLDEALAERVEQRRSE